MKTMMWPDEEMQCTSKMILTYHDWSNQVFSVTKTIQDNDMIDRTSVVYVENDIELLWPIESGVDCDENHIEQLCD